MLLAPGALGAWSMGGNVEPDTPHDVAGPMWSMPDRDAGGPMRLYFNAIATQSVQSVGLGVHFVPGARLSPNAVEGMRLAPVAQVEALAFLGVWRDCNGDGYVGHARSAMWQYRDELLPDESVCPDGSRFRAGGWVWEMLDVVTYREDAGDFTAQRIHDRDAAVWGDVGAPGAAPEAFCGLTPMPRGTLARTGGLLGYADCQAAHHVVAPLATAESLGLPLGFDDPQRPEQDCDAALNRPVGLFHDPNRCEGEPRGQLEPGAPPAFTAYDCAGPNLAVRDPQGSAYAALGATRDALVACPGSPAAGAPVPAFPSLQILSLTWLLEAPYSPAAASDGKRAVDFAMQPPHMGTLAEKRLRPDGPLAGTPTTLGLAPLSDAIGHGWRTFDGVHRHLGPTFRSDGTPRAALELSFYARVGDATLALAALPSVANHVYGAESCGMATTGVLGGWDCDADNWWRPDLGGATAPVGAAAARVGWPYHLRDVDCLDNTLVDGVRASPAALTDAGGCA